MRNDAVDFHVKSLGMQWSQFLWAVVLKWLRHNIFIW